MLLGLAFFAGVVTGFLFFFDFSSSYKKTLFFNAKILCLFEIKILTTLCSLPTSDNSSSSSSSETSSSSLSESLRLRFCLLAPLLARPPPRPRPAAAGRPRLPAPTEAFLRLGTCRIAQNYQWLLAYSNFC